MGIGAQNLETSLGQQLIPVLDSTLQRAKRRHHDQIQSNGLLMRTRVGNDNLINQQLRVRAKSGPNLRKNGQSSLLGPIVKNMAQVVELGAFDGLFGEEIVRSGIDAIQRRQVSQGLLQLLENNLVLELWERTEQLQGLVAETSTDIDKDGFAGKVTQLLLEWEYGEPRATGRHDGHGLLDGLEALGLRGQPCEHGEGGIKRLLGGSLSGMVDVLVFVLYQEFWKGCKNWANVVKGVVDFSSVARGGEDLGGVIGSECVNAGFLDLANRGKVAQNTA